MAILAVAVLQKPVEVINSVLVVLLNSIRTGNKGREDVEIENVC